MYIPPRAARSRAARIRGLTLTRSSYVPIFSTTAWLCPHCEKLCSTWFLCQVSGLRAGRMAKLRTTSGVPFLVKHLNIQHAINTINGAPSKSGLPWCPVLFYLGYPFSPLSLTTWWHSRMCIWQVLFIKWVIIEFFFVRNLTVRES